MRAGRRRWLVLELALALVAAVCLGWAAHVRLAMAAFDRAAPSMPLADVRSVSVAVPVAHGAAIGRLAIPRLGLADVVLQGDDDDTLRVAIGHLPDTPLPWQPGNSAVAGHRDTRFRALRGIRAGDDVTLETSDGTLHYRVRETRIVLPTDLSVLAPTETPTLTLITCYPFSYIGHAPKRFVVLADRVDVE